MKKEKKKMFLNPKFKCERQKFLFLSLLCKSKLYGGFVLFPFPLYQTPPLAFNNFVLQIRGDNEKIFVILYLKQQTSNRMKNIDFCTHHPTETSESFISGSSSRLDIKRLTRKKFTFGSNPLCLLNRMLTRCTN